MNKLMIAVMTALAVSTLFSENAPAKKKLLPYPASKMAEFNAMTGGMVDPPANAKVLMFLDARETDVPVLTKSTKVAEELVEVAIDTKRIKLSDQDDPKKIAFGSKRDKVGAVVLIYERTGEPVLSAFPEDGVVLVNVEPLRADKPDANLFCRRFVTEFWRSIAFALGGYGLPAQFSNSMQPIFSLKDYDSLGGAGLMPVHIGMITKSKWKLGITGRDAVPYSHACVEGWAPAPTNDVQKSFYEKSRNTNARFQRDFKK